jgi:hypothetical protein
MQQRLKRKNATDPTQRNYYARAILWECMDIVLKGINNAYNAKF